MPSTRRICTCVLVCSGPGTQRRVSAWAVVGCCAVNSQDNRGEGFYFKTGAPQGIPQWALRSTIAERALTTPHGSTWHDRFYKHEFLEVRCQPKSCDSHEGSDTYKPQHPVL